MGLINLKYVTPDMVLADAVYSHLGTLLLRENRALTEKDILLLEAWGVREVNIEGVESVETQEPVYRRLSEEEIAALDVALDEKFSDLQEDEITMEMKKVVREIRIEEMIKSKGERPFAPTGNG